MICPKTSAAIWNLSQRYAHEAQRDAYLELAQQVWERTFAQWSGEAGPSTDPNEVAHAALGFTSDFLLQHADEIDKEVLAKAGTDDRGDWYNKPFAKAAAFEYLHDFEMSDAQVAALMRMMSAALAQRVVEAATAIEDDKRTAEIHHLANAIFMGARTQQALLDELGMPDAMRKAGDVKRSVGVDSERVVFDQFMALMCKALGADREVLKSAERDIFQGFVANKAAIVAKLG